MSKKFYIGICCLALLATSVASGYSEDFNGYTGNVGDAWDATTEFGTSGWGNMHRLTSTWNTDSIELNAGYNTTQGVAILSTGDTDQSAARLLDAPQGPSSTFVYTGMIKLESGANDAGMFFGTDELTAPQDHHDGWFWVWFHSSDVLIQYGINATSRIDVGWLSAGDWGSLGWVEHRIEADTNANARPTTMRYYYRDLHDDGSGPAEAWNQVNLGGAGGGIDLDVTGDDWQIEAIGFGGMGDTDLGLYYDNFYATPEPVTLAILGIGGLLALIRRRRG